MLFFKSIEFTQLCRCRKPKTILSSKAGKADNSCHLQLVIKPAFPRDPRPPGFNAEKGEHALLWPARNPLLQLLTQSTGWPFASAALNAFKWKTWAGKSGWCSEWGGLKRRGRWGLSCQVLSHSPVPGNPIQNTLHGGAELCYASRKHHPKPAGNTTEITQWNML